MRRKNGQVWIESVLYTLIGLALIALVLAFITPKINEAKDRLVIEQTISSLNELDARMNIRPGNIRHIDFTMKRGELYINGTGDKIIFMLDNVKAPYSEPGIPSNIGRIKVLTEKMQKGYSVFLTLDYAGIINLKYKDEDVTKKFTAAPIPYKLSIASKASEGLDIINIEEISR